MTATTESHSGIDTNGSAASPESPAVSRTGLLGLSRFALPIILLLLVVVFSAMRPDTFATLGNLQTVLSTQSVLAILALSALVVLIIGEFDLSIGYQLGFAALLVPGLSSIQGLSLGLSIVVAVAATTAIGFVNGLFVAKVKINSFIATIGMGALISAAMLWYSEGAVIFEGVPPELLTIASGDLVGIPLPVLYVAVLAWILWVVLQRTPFGRHMSAVGGSRDAARLAGVNTDLVTIVTFTITGMLAGLAGVLQAAQLGTGNPAVGPPLLLPAFAAVFLGATSFAVGTYNVAGTITAVITIATGVAGLALLGVPQWVDPFFNGAALLVAVTATRYLRRQSQ